jgi:hypothetical protein
MARHGQKESRHLLTVSFHHPNILTFYHNYNLFTVYIETGSSASPTTLAFAFGTVTASTAIQKTWKVLW